MFSNIIPPPRTHTYTHTNYSISDNPCSQSMGRRLHCTSEQEHNGCCLYIAHKHSASQSLSCCICHVSIHSTQTRLTAALNTAPPLSPLHTPFITSYSPTPPAPHTPSSHLTAPPLPLHTPFITSYSSTPPAPHTPSSHLTAPPLPLHTPLHHILLVQTGSSPSQSPLASHVLH